MTELDFSDPGQEAGEISTTTIAGFPALTPLDLGEVERDRWGRGKAGGVACTRASSLGKLIEDSSALMNWGARMAAWGVAQDPVAVDHMRMLNPADPADKQALQRLATDGKDRAQANARAKQGDVFHQVSVMVDQGRDISHLSPEAQAFGRVYAALIAKYQLRPLLAETYVGLVDGARPGMDGLEIPVSGSYDRVYQGPKKVLIGDLKTGSTVDFSGLAFSAQLSVYTRGVIWSTREQRWIDYAELGMPAPDRGIGVVLHIPADRIDEAAVYTVDLEFGWEVAQVAARVKSMRTVAQSALKRLGGL